MLPLRRQLSGVICQSCKSRLLKQLPATFSRTWRRSYANHDHLRGRSSLPIDDPASWNTVRNIGIIAHIDAGKTTTTERMLYYSGITSDIGEVDAGSTVTDYLPTERERGITIVSAAITLQWPPEANSHTINLIDTPGHADFTFEVERSIRVLDGAVVVLDGVAGVEAQTEKVWAQARNYNIPALVFVNKLDRVGGDFSMCVKDVYMKLQGAKPAPIQIPLLESGSSRRQETFTGVVDVVEQKVIRWDQDSLGKEMEIFPISELKDQPKIQEEARIARQQLVELLTQEDDTLIERWDEVGGNSEKLTVEDLKQSIRRCVLNRTGIVPVLAGAAFRNQGVQPVLDAVLAYLPNPGEAGSGNVPALLNRKTALLNVQELGDVCALVFKVVYDEKMGFQSYVRVYSGVLTKGSWVFNTNTQTGAPVHRLMRMFANHTVDIPAIHAGHIGVIYNYENARTGDTLISGKVLGPNPHKHRGKLNQNAKLSKEDKENPLLNTTLQLQPINVPPPVFFMSVEPYSQADKHHLDHALNILTREDPSLRLTIDPDSGQTLLSGMGELHLEIAQGRLINELKAKARLSEIRISYREIITGTVPEHAVYESNLENQRSYGGASVTLEPIREGEPRAEPDSATLVVHDEDNNEILVNFTKEMWLPSGTNADQVAHALAAGCGTGLLRGIDNYPLYSTRVSVTVTTDDIDTDTSLSSLSAAATAAVSKAIQKGGTSLMEPFMKVTISVPEGDIGMVQSDISSDGGSLLELNPFEEEEQKKREPSDVYAPPSSYISTTLEADRGLRNDAPSKMATIQARMPLKKLIGYWGKLRSMTRGHGSFLMTYDRYERMTDARIRALTQAGELQLSRRP